MKTRKEDILKATLELAAANGLGTVSMQQIADKVGITKASLYNHYSSRDEIVEAMYEYLRQVSKDKANIAKPDYDKLSAGVALKDILTLSVNSYRSIVNDPQMLLFYKIIISERSISKTAAEIMVKETKTMIDATKALFYALQVKGIADFKDADASAFSFAMGVHAILDYEFDLSFAGEQASKGMMDAYIEEFSRIYGKKVSELK